MIIENISNDDYHAREGLSSSQLKKILISPAHFAESVKETSDAMDFGTAVHMAILEPDLFEKTYIADPLPNGDRRTKEGKARYDDLLSSGKKILKMSEMTDALRMRDRFHSHAVGKKLYDKSRRELSAFATDPETGVLIKSRADILHESDVMIIADIKTCNDARPAAAANAIASYQYDLSAALYLDVFSEALKRPVVTFLWVFIEKKPPYGIRTYLANQEVLHNGRRLYKKAINEYVVSRDFNHWPAYKEDVDDINLPNWYLLKD